MNYSGIFCCCCLEDIKTVRHEKAKEQKETNSSPVTRNLSMQQQQPGVGTKSDFYPQCQTKGIPVFRTTHFGAVIMEWG